jgi:LysM repeat protein
MKTEQASSHPLGRDMSTALLIKQQYRTDVVGSTPRRAGELPRVVSATSLTAHAEVRAMERPSVPNYALRRFVVGGVVGLAFIVAMFGVIAMSAGLSSSPASAASAAQLDVQPSPAVHVAQAGDTMWSIANTYRGDVDRGRFIDALIRLNGGVEIQAGQAVWLP